MKSKMRRFMSDAVWLIGTLKTEILLLVMVAAGLIAYSYIEPAPVTAAYGMTDRITGLPVVRIFGGERLPDGHYKVEPRRGILLLRSWKDDREFLYEFCAPWDRKANIPPRRNSGDEFTVLRGKVV